MMRAKKTIVVAAVLMALPVLAELGADWTKQREESAAVMKQARGLLAEAPKKEKKLDKKTRKYLSSTRKGFQKSTGFARALVPSLLASGEALTVAAADESKADAKSPIAAHLRDMAATYEALAATLKKGSKIRAGDAATAQKSLAKAEKNWKKVAKKLAKIGQVRADCQAAVNQDKALSSMCPITKAIDGAMRSLDQGYEVLAASGKRDDMIAAAKTHHSALKTSMQLPDPNAAPS